MSTANTSTKYPDVWIFDQNRRVYRKTCGLSGSPIWREHWVKLEVIGETSRSWLTHRGKIPKAGGRGIAFSQEDITELEWVQERRYKIVRLVERLNDPRVLRQIAKLVGYKDDPENPT